MSLPLDGADMRILRRISAAFKDIPGGQFLGATCDYTHRFLNFDLLNCDLLIEDPGEAVAGEQAAVEDEAIHARRVSDELRREGLITVGEDDPDPQDQDPWDITEEPLVFPAHRPARLQTLARADTGYISGLAYVAIRGFGSGHPTVGELRAGTLEVTIPYPLASGQGIGEKLFVGDIEVTEVESLFPEEDREAKREAKDDPLKIMASGQGDKADSSLNSLS